MSKEKEKRLKRQSEKAAKIEESIKNGAIRWVANESRKKKPSLPNRLCPFKSPEDEMEDRQETVEKAVMVYHRMLSNLLPKLSRIKDPRKPEKIKHKMKVLLVYGILMSMYQIGSRREANRTISRPIFFDNLNEMFPEFTTIPHADTLGRLLKQLEVAQIQQCMIELLKDLIRSKKFKNFLHKKHYLIAIDGTQKFTRDYQWASECLERHVGGEARIPQYYCYVLEAVLILENGIVLPVMSEFIENGEHNKNENKQDCERKGFYRMAKKLKEIFHSIKLTIVADGLYACGPVITVCKKYCWDYMIVLKEGSLPDVWKEALALMKINPEERLKCDWGDRKQTYSWANGIEYEYVAETIRKKVVFNVVICYETWTEEHSRSTGIIEKKETRYAWLSSREISDKNAFYRCTKIGRYRWKIENNILIEKHQGYEYQHCFSYTWNAMKGFHYLMKIGHFLNALALNSELLADKVRELGIRGFIKYLKLACEGSTLDKKRIKAARERKFLWKLELVA
ncbi:MAG: transposase family protein [Candidatus Atribacteria bacterium]|nr:transposase family protein [Candidatus Atribacteria bacterium]